MKFFKGQNAVDFSVRDIYGKEIKLSDYKGKKILLGFFRNVNCPFCNLRAHQFSKLREAFEERNLQMIFFFESKPELMLKSIFHRDISPIPLVGDPEKIIYSMYGVERSIWKQMKTSLMPGTSTAMKEGKRLNLPEEKDRGASANLIPADFLIDENFKVVKAHYGEHINDHLSIDEVKAFAGLAELAGINH